MYITCFGILLHGSYSVDTATAFLTHYHECKKKKRGYAYVGVSRFKTREGCHLYGVLRQSDFLPVGADKEGEIWERGYDSLNESDSEYEGNRHMGFEEDTDDEEEFGHRSYNELNRPPDPEAYEPRFNADFDF